MSDPDYDIPGFWFIQRKRDDIDCDGTYPLEPVMVLASDLDDALNRADDLIVTPDDCTVTGPLVERRATMAEIDAWLESVKREAAAAALEEAANWLEQQEAAVRASGAVLVPLNPPGLYLTADGLRKLATTTRNPRTPGEETPNG